jgi:hypothetical protein
LVTPGKQDGIDAVNKRKMAAATSEVGVVDEDGLSDDDSDNGENSDLELDQFAVKNKGKAKKAAASKGGKAGAKGKLKGKAKR